MVERIYIFDFAVKLYPTFFVCGFVGVFLYLICICRKYEIKKWKTVIYTVLVYGSSLLWMFVLYWVDTGFKSWGGNNIVRVFWWLGVFSIIVSKLLKEDKYKCLDMVAPCLCINHGIAHFGCIFAGCCHGYPNSCGIYSNEVEYVCFPTQPIEAIIALIIAFLIWKREKSKGYKNGIDGLSFPIMLMLFGYSRFFLEFLRDNDKIFYITKSIVWAGKPVFGVSQLALHALLNGVIGTAAYLLIKKHNVRKVQKVS